MPSFLQIQTTELVVRYLMEEAGRTAPYLEGKDKVPGGSLSGSTGE